MIFQGDLEFHFCFFIQRRYMRPLWPVLWCMMYSTQVSCCLCMSHSQYGKQKYKLASSTTNALLLYNFHSCLTFNTCVQKCMPCSWIFFRSLQSQSHPLLCLLLAHKHVQLGGAGPSLGTVTWCSPPLLDVHNAATTGFRCRKFSSHPKTCCRRTETSCSWLQTSLRAAGIWYLL